MYLLDRQELIFFCSEMIVYRNPSRVLWNSSPTAFKPLHHLFQLEKYSLILDYSSGECLMSSLIAIKMGMCYERLK